ncbi:MAG: molybdopterin-dependent oxidoreductase [Spirosomataceae bacterium]
MKNLLRCLFLTVALAYCATRSIAQSIKVKGEVITPLTLTKEDLQKLPQLEITAKDNKGNSRLFAGVAVADVLKQAGVTLGGQLRGENLVKYVIAKASDGYEVLFALPELDPEFTDQVVLLAYLSDGKPLPAGEGNFRLVVPKDKKHARWIRELDTLEVRFAK